VTKLLVLLSFGLVFALGVVPVIAFGDNPHPPGCKGNPHDCRTTAPASTALTTAATITEMVTIAAPSSSSSSSSTSSASASETVTVIVPPSKVATIVKVKVKNVRRYCTMQRHGWRCIGHPPRAR
jgi:hypothetical protein